MRPAHRLVLIGALAAGLGCERPAATGAPIGVPPDAILLISAPSLSSLRDLAREIEPIPAAESADEQKPAWLACEAAVCVLRRGAPAAKLQRSAEQVRVPDGDGSLVIWGIDTDTKLEPLLERWRSGTPPPVGWAGFVEPEVLLAAWKPSRPRAKELVERATFQAGRIDFTAQTADDATTIELRMKPRPGEPAFVGSLGAPTVDPPDVAGLLVDDLAVLLRLSADPHKLWALVRSTLTVEQRAALEELLASLRTDAALDVEAQVIDTLTGHVYVIAYGRSELANPALVDWLTLGATREAVVLPLRDRAPIRRALGAWTQLSRGRLQALTTAAANEEQKDEWGFFEDGKLRFSVVLGADFVAFVDSADALDRVRGWGGAAALPPGLSARGVAELLGGRDRYGLYADGATLEAWLGAARFGSIALAVVPTTDGEVVRVRLGHALRRALSP